jgi:hypothetical protein
MPIKSCPSNRWHSKVDERPTAFQEEGISRTDPGTTMGANISNSVPRGRSARSLSALPVPSFPPRLSSPKTNHSLDFEPVQDIDDLTRYQEYIHRELPRFFREVVDGAATRNHLLLEEETRYQMMASLPEALNRAFSTFRATLDQIPSAAIRDETPQDVSPLHMMQNPVQESGESMLSSGPRYGSHGSYSGTLCKATENNDNTFNEVYEQSNPVDMRSNSNIPLPEMGPFQPTQSEISVTEPRLSFGGGNDMASVQDDLLIDSQSVLADSWSTMVNWDEWDART